MLLFLLATTVILVAITLLPLAPSNHWLFRVWEFPRVQISVLLLVNGIASGFLLSADIKYVLVLANFVCLTYQLVWIFPYTILARKQVKKVKASDDQHKLSFITSNVLTPNRSVHKLLALLKEYQPDVLVTLESDSWWQDALQAIHEDYPYRVAKPLDNLYGIHVYSKYKLTDIEVIDLIEKDIPSVHCKLQMGNNTTVKCHFLHPCPPSPTENESAKPRDRELLLVAEKVRPKEEPTIVTGDLNDVAWSPTTRAFRQKSGLLDPRLGRGFFNTFHAQHKFARWPLDHIFHSDHFELLELKRLPSIDSDHFPLYSSFSVK